MDPSIEAAWIAAGAGALGALVGVAGTVIVSISGYRNTMRSTEKTFNAGRDQDIWEKRADAYVDTIAALLQRSTASEGELIPLDRKRTRLNSSHLVISYAV